MASDPKKPNSRNYMRGWFRVALKDDRAAVRAALAEHFGDRTVAFCAKKAQHPLTQEIDPMTDIRTLSNTQLVELYNRMSDKKVRRFSSGF